MNRKCREALDVLAGLAARRPLGGGLGEFIFNCLGRMPHRHATISTLLCGVHENCVESIRAEILSYSLRKLFADAAIAASRVVLSRAAGRSYSFCLYDQSVMGATDV